mmetsp:Transcript_74538/g.117502  ORF Transcript_74538/g.117502 Transcript_74538/m.117502 type:complete len:170 (-) Transcript_74538:319-828(-)
MLNVSLLRLRVIASAREENYQRRHAPSKLQTSRVTMQVTRSLLASCGLRSPSRRLSLCSTFPPDDEGKREERENSHCTFPRVYDIYANASFRTNPHSCFGQSFLRSMVHLSLRLSPVLSEIFQGGYSRDRCTNDFLYFRRERKHPFHFKCEICRTVLRLALCLFLTRPP